MRFIGCKMLLLDNIKELVDRKAPAAKTFCDIFSGAATVARYFKQWYEVTSNELLFFSYVLQWATVENDGRMYINDENALRIDFARNKVEDWRIKSLISENE